MASTLVLQHVEAEGPARISDFLVAAGSEVIVHRTDQDPEVPALDGFDGLVVMGGPMDAHRDDGFPTRRDELRLIGTALDRRVPVLGVCLGAQLLAIAGGAAAFPGVAGPEIGWAPVTFTADATTDRLLGPVAALGGAEVLHWHGDTFSLPPDAVRLASSDRYENQAFRLGPCAWGVQFHLEVDEQAVATFVAAFATDVEQAPGGAARILEQSADCIEALVPVTDAVLSGFAAVVTAPR